MRFFTVTAGANFPRMLLRDLGRGLLHLFYPILCEGCHQPLVSGEQTLCLGCAALLPRTGFHRIAHNEAAARFAGRLPYEQATAFAYFTAGGMLQHLLHRLKYDEQKEVGLNLGKRFGAELKEQDWGSGVDAIVPVPLHPRKLAARGYNQSDLLAEGLSESLGKPVLREALLRNRATESQTRKSRQQRLDNVSSAFTTGHPDALRGSHLLLIDDVLTTGATLEAAALALLAVEGVKVSIATIGIAV